MLSKHLAKSLAVLIVLSSGHLYAATCDFTVTNEWNGGFTSSVAITNDTDQMIDGWAVAIDFADSASISHMWNASFSGNGPYQATNLSYNGKIQPNSTKQFGFNAQKATKGAPISVPTFGGICSNSTENQPPIARATASPLEGNIPLTVNFDANGSTDPDGDNLSYRWVFADGTSLNGVAVTRTFAEAGAYTAQLTVNDGNLDSATTNVTINAREPASVAAAQCSYSVNNEWNSGLTATIKITNNTQQPINGWAMSLVYPDGTSITNIWNANLSGSNPYQLTNKSYNGTLQPNSTIEFGFNAQKQSSGTAATPILSGICAAVSANQPPNANAVVSPQQGVAPLTVNLNASNSTDPDGDNLSYHWNFGDGSSSTDSVTTRTFLNAGSYTVTLTVTDSANNTDSTNVMITVTEPTSSPPTAKAAVSSRQGIAPLMVSFDASESSDPDGDTLSYHWDFGDGSSSSQPITTRNFTDAGTYTVTLTVTDSANDTGTTSVIVTVIDPDPDPQSAYLLDAAQSSLHFVSTKKTHVVETHTFTELSGEISDAGIAVVRINLDSVETGIDVRNGRMREHLFETDTFSQAEITLNVDMPVVSNIPIGDSLVQDITPTVDLHGFSVPLAARIKTTRLTAGTFLVQNISPMIVKAADFGLTDGIDTLKDLAKLSVISYSVPTNFTLIFNKQ